MLYSTTFIAIFSAIMWVVSKRGQVHFILLALVFFESSKTTGGALEKDTK